MNGQEVVFGCLFLALVAAAHVRMPRTWGAFDDTSSFSSLATSAVVSVPLSIIQLQSFQISYFGHRNSFCDLFDKHLCFFDVEMSGNSKVALQKRHLRRSVALGLHDLQTQWADWYLLYLAGNSVILCNLDGPTAKYFMESPRRDSRAKTI